MAGSLYIYGKVGADVMPVTTGFRREMERGIARQVRGYEVEIPVVFDPDSKKLAAWKKRLESDELNLKAEIEPGTKSLEKWLKTQGGKELGSLRVPLEADTREFERDFRKTSNQLEDLLTESVRKGSKAGFDNAKRAYEALRRHINNGKVEITAEVELDMNEADRRIGELGRTLKVADRFDQQADQLERRARLMAERFPDIDVDVNIDKAVSDLRKLANDVRNGKDIDFNVKGKVEADMDEANRELDRFKEKHKKLEMDVDVSTKLASAHLKYFTRPRTVDIYANFKGTDLGKIINGITYGATGLESVTNQFQKLVKLFDSLDDVVPKFSLIGAAAISLGAGLLNLGRSAGGVGVSLVSMSKAALAAPAALTGLAAAGYSAYAAYQVASKQFDVTATSLAGMTDAVGTAAWNEFGDELYRIANEIAPTLRDGLTGIATEEGKVAAGLLQVVEQSDKAGELANIFSQTQRMVAELNPGLQDLVASFLDLGDETSEYLPRMGGYISDVAASMADWVEQARQSGAITDAMESAIEQGGYLKDSFKSLTGILSGTFGTLAQTENGIEGISDALAKADRAVNSVKFQETLESWSSGAQTAQNNMRDSLDDIGDALYSLRDEAEQVFGDAGAIVGSGIEGISRVLEQSGDGIRDFSSGIRDGFEQVFDAVGDAGPMFDELLSMVGQLSKTFGGTLASGLRTAAPLITSIAKAAETAAKAFDALPDSVKGAITMYMTFGRAGKQALDSLKIGMLNNIQQTIQYQKTLQQAGITASAARASFIDLGKAMMNVHSGNYAQTFTSMGKSMTTAGTAASDVGKSVSGLSGVFGKVKSAASGLGSVLLGAVGGPAGLAITAAIAAITWAFSDYQNKADATKQANENLASSFDQIASQGNVTSETFEGINESIKEILNTENYGDADGIFGWFDHLGDKYKTAQEAADDLKISQDDVIDAINGGKPGLDAFNDSLTEMANESMRTNKGIGTNVGAVNELRETVNAAAEELLNNAKATAKLNGVSTETIDTMYEQGESFDSIAIAAMSASQKIELQTSATSKLNDILDKSSDAKIRASRAASSYEGQLDSMASVIEEVNQLQADGEVVWNEAAENFNYTSEAGRKAGDAMTDLVESANDYLEAMVNNGATLDEVTAKQSTMRDELVKQATAFTGSEDSAKAYVDSLLTTPSELETKINLEKQQAQSDLLDYINLVQVLFPDNGRTATRDLLIKGVVQGKLDVEKLQDIVNQLSDGKHTVMLDSNGQIVVTELEGIEERAHKLSDGTWHVNLTAEDYASGKLETLKQNVEKFGASDSDVKILLDAQDDASDKIENAILLGKAFGLTQEEMVLIANTDNASSKLDGIKQDLQEMYGLSDEQIEILLDAIDNASPKMDELERKKVPAAKGISFTIDADDTSAQTKISNVRQYEGQVIANPWAIVHGDNTDAMNKFMIVMGYDGATISQPWGRVLGDNLDAMNKFGEIIGYDGATIARPWGRVRGENNEARNAFNEVRAYDGRTISQPWGRVMGNADNAWSVFRSIQSMNGTVLATRYVNIITRSSGEVRAATGGHISGPGTGTSDSIPAMLSNGEFVLRAASVRKLESKYGSGILDYLNRMGEIPNHRVSSTVERYRRDSYAYASGGRVRMPDMQTVSVKQPAQVVKSGPTYNTTQNIYYPAFAPTQITLNKKLDTAATYQL